MDKVPRKQLESLLENYFNPKGWNYAHTITAVYWMDRLIKGEGGNPRVLVPAMYLHDIGYMLIKKDEDNNLAERRAMKEKHMELGAEEAQRVLPSLQFSQKEINEISYLISVHDKVYNLTTLPEKMVFEADTLSQIDVRRVKPSYDKSNWAAYLKTSIDEKRSPLFFTKTGKKFLAQLLPRARSYSVVS